MNFWVARAVLLVHTHRLLEDGSCSSLTWSAAAWRRQTPTG